MVETTQESDGVGIEIQVPAHNEPPEVLCETLNHLAQLDYQNFSVLVIDNNTEDPAVWMPVERHCQELGDRFCFVRQEGLQGAKAGALNYVLAEHSDRDAELIAVVDADYHVEPDWLSAVIGHFEDPGDRLCADSTRLSRLADQPLSAHVRVGIRVLLPHDDALAQRAPRGADRRDDALHRWCRHPVASSAARNVASSSTGMLSAGCCE
jgi:cellulose synthase/poly-beta-1,6-N-acetylglucosamine synthase-like glycosyltransferase